MLHVFDKRLLGMLISLLLCQPLQANLTTRFQRMVDLSRTLRRELDFCLQSLSVVYHCALVSFFSLSLSLVMFVSDL